MAQTQAQLLAAAKAQLAKTKARLKAAEDEQAILKASTQSSAVDTTRLSGIEAASKGTTGYVPPVDTYSTVKVGSTGKTQAQIDALANARSTAALIRDTSTTMTSKVDPATGMVVTTPKGTTGGGAVLGTGADTGADTGAGGDTALAIATAEAAKLKLLADQEAARIAEEKRVAGQSAYDLLFEQFSRYGMGSLVEPLKQFIQQGISSSEFTLRLRDTDAYKKRFAANASRIAKGLSALNEAEYIGLEDQYQNIMRQYGLPASYYTRGDMGRQEGFEKFLANDVSAAELEDRVLTAQSRVINANPEVLASLKQFYPGISDGDILAYTLDPEKALTDIKRKVTAAEIGGSAMQAGLGISGTRAEELGAAGVTKAQAQQGFQTVAEVAPRGGMLADIYKQSPYTQTTAEAEVFGLAGSTEAARQRKKLTSLETAAFQGSAGAGAIARDRAGVL
jgi:hypothetical protein